LLNIFCFYVDFVLSALFFIKYQTTLIFANKKYVYVPDIQQM